MMEQHKCMYMIATVVYLIMTKLVMFAEWLSFIIETDEYEFLTYEEV